MGIVKLDWLPDECTYCENPVSCIIIKTRFLRNIKVEVCKECAKEIWNEETNRRLP